MSAVTVRVGRPDDLVAAMRVLDGSLLDVEATTVKERLDADAVLLAAVAGRVVGVLVLDGDHVEAVAVRRNRRRSGIGSALVDAAVDRRGHVTAAFRPAVRGFYEALGFDVEKRDGRLWGVRE